jgi:hypothetical protein
VGPLQVTTLTPAQVITRGDLTGQVGIAVPGMQNVHRHHRTATPFHPMTIEAARGRVTASEEVVVSRFAPPGLTVTKRDSVVEPVLSGPANLLLSVTEGDPTDCSDVATVAGAAAEAPSIPTEVARRPRCLPRCNRL